MQYAHQPGLPSGSASDDATLATSLNPNAMPQRSSYPHGSRTAISRDGGLHKGAVNDPVSCPRKGSMRSMNIRTAPSPSPAAAPAQKAVPVKKAHPATAASGLTILPQPDAIAFITIQA